MLKYLRIILLPFSLLYGLAVIFRNLFFDRGIFRSASFSLPVISVGNLTIGGTGKTPVTEYLVRLFPGKRIAILSRGYGRITKGFRIAHDHDTAMTIGDEPMQYFKKFEQVTVAVCEDRVKGINLLKGAHDLVILDDAFQHRWIKPGLSILLFDYQSFKHFEFLLPAGNLREPASGYKRADMILITKSPGYVPLQEMARIRKRFDNKYPLTYSSIEYDELKPLGNNPSRSCAITGKTVIILITGIANPAPLLNYLEGKGTVLKHFDFPDHHRFSYGDVERLANIYFAAEGEDKIIITTEKDAQRLLTAELNKLLVNLPLYYLPVKARIHDEGQEAFDKKIKDYVAGPEGNR